ncbi:hypothetical protein GOP47_0007461 [Adiantum capillus-veneris]|uniref:Uncharacterized protein n=1 Tax=Adiantum capillus-veneris TaxID=13818 RepID=A0A9D4V271_ADICA|nr:hypothetical protein GOP47_0007461 [Adiantum capillus-veneris]
MQDLHTSEKIHDEIVGQGLLEKHVVPGNVLVKMQCEVLHTVFTMNELLTRPSTLDTCSRHPLGERFAGQCLALVTVACTSVNGLAVAEVHSSKAPQPLESCADIAHYYDHTIGLQGKALRNRLFKIVRNHRVLSYHQTWDALKFLDAAESRDPEASPEIIEIYSQKAVSKSLAGKPDGWNREHLWPSSYGLKRGQPEFTDLHNLRPADANVNSARGKKYFGECMPAIDKTCLMPAFKESAADTATSKKFWMPPRKVRGDIARSLMYMVVRYGVDKHGEGSNLQLSDTPNKGRAQMGKLSVLLQWNLEDPPSNEERLRNFRVCALFQHNRNPFVDHPEFASQIWGARSAQLL